MPLADGHDDVLYGQGVFQGQVAPRDIPPPIARRYLEADDVRPVVLEHLYGEVIIRPVEDNNAASVRASILRIHHLVSTRLTRINTLCDISLLEYFHVHVGLGRSAQGGFQSPNPTVPDVVPSEMDRTYHPLSVAPTSLLRNACTLTHTQLTYIVR